MLSLHQALFLAGISFSLVSISACSIKSGGRAQTPSSPPSPAGPSAPVANPSGLSGPAVLQSACAGCHNANGRSPDLSASSPQLSQDELNAISAAINPQGGAAPAMPPGKPLGADQLAALNAWIKNSGPDAPAAPAGQAPASPSATPPAGPTPSPTSSPSASVDTVLQVQLLAAGASAGAGPASTAGSQPADASSDTMTLIWSSGDQGDGQSAPQTVAGASSGLFSLDLGAMPVGTPLDAVVMIFDAAGDLIAGPQDFNSLVVPSGGKVPMSITVGTGLQIGISD